MLHPTEVRQIQEALLKAPTYVTTVRSLVKACANAAAYHRVHVTCPEDGYPVLAFHMTAAGPVVVTGMTQNSGLDGKTYLSANQLTKAIRAYPAATIVQIVSLGVL